MKRALVITPFSPVPDFEGHRKRILSTIRILKDLGYRVDIYFACIDDYWRHRAGREQRDGLVALAETVHFVLGEQPPSAPEGQDFGLDDWICPGFEEMAAWLAARNDYDLVFCNYVFLSKLLTPFGTGVAKILDTHDRFSGRADILRSNASPVQFFHCSERDEARGLDRADLVLSIKEHEAVHFREITSVQVLNLPYCETDKPVPANATGMAEATVRFGFFGSSNLINYTNFVAFLAAYRRHPLFLAGARLDIHVYGGVCEHLRDLDCAGLRVGGPLRDVREFYEAVDCVLIPQHFSTGLKIKMAEAMSFGVPIVAHRHAAEGLIDDPDCDFLFDDFDALADACFQFSHAPEALASIRAAVSARQGALQDATRRAVAAIANFLSTFRIPITLVVDGALLQASQVYRGALHAICTGLSHRGRVFLLVVGGSDEARLEAMVTGWTYAEICAIETEAQAVETLVAPANGTCFLAIPLGVQDMTDIAARRRLFRFEALVAFVAASRSVPVPPLPHGVVAILSRFQPAKSGVADHGQAVPIMHFRWPPWDMMLRGRLKHGAQMTRPLVAVTCGVTAAIGKDLVSVCACGACADLSVGALEDRMLRRGQFPRVVIDKSGGAPSFALLFELFFWNGIPVIAGDEDRDETRRNLGLHDFGMSALLNPRHARAPAQMDWAATGFPELQRLAALEYEPIGRESLSP